MMEIENIVYALPEQIISNDDLKVTYPDWEMDELYRKTGVASRHIATADETAVDLAERACQQLITMGYDLEKDIDTLIFCTETPDHQIPPNSGVLHGRLKMPQHVCAFDISIGCSGYAYALEMARCLIAGGRSKKIMLVTGDTYSHLIKTEDRATRTLFGDGAAVTILTPSANDDAFIDCELGTSGKDYKKFYVPGGGARTESNNDTANTVSDKIEMDGFGLIGFFNSVLPRHVKGILAKNDLNMDDVDLFVFHQASMVVLDGLKRALQIPDEKMAVELNDVGNLVSASIPVTLKRAADKGQVKPRGLVLLCGFGVGLSWGSALIRLPSTFSNEDVNK